MAIVELYKPKGNALVDLYPNTKFFILVCYSLISILLGTIKVNGYPIYMMLWFLAVPVLCLASGIFKRFISLFSKLLILIFLIVVFQAFLAPDGSKDILFQIGPIKAYVSGFQNALKLCFSIMNIGGIFIWFFQTTENKELVYVLQMSKLSHQAAYVLLSTLQMIEELKKTSQVIMNAQMARGVETEGNLKVRAKAFLPSIIPLVIGSISSIEERALTLEARGFTAPCEKTHIFKVDPSGKERIATLIASGITLIMIIGVVISWVS